VQLSTQVDKGGTQLEVATQQVVLLPSTAAILVEKRGPNPVYQVQLELLVRGVQVLMVWVGLGVLMVWLALLELQELQGENCVCCI
jgi:hypothetical protein